MTSDIQKGVTSIEYALLAMLIAVAVLVAIKEVGTATSSTFDKLIEAYPTGAGNPNTSNNSGGCGAGGKGDINSSGKCRR